MIRLRYIYLTMVLPGFAPSPIHQSNYFPFHMLIVKARKECTIFSDIWQTFLLIRGLRIFVEMLTKKMICLATNGPSKRSERSIYRWVSIRIKYSIRLRTLLLRHLSLHRTSSAHAAVDLLQTETITLNFTDSMC